MEITDFGQIKIYETYFEDLDLKSIRRTPTECIENKLNYSGIYKNRELPIMIGSKFSHPNDNPLKIKGYFIINGICKSINNIKIDQKTCFTKDRAYLNDGSKIEIIDMFNYKITLKNKSRQWFLPINWRKITEFSEHKSTLFKHLQIVSKYGNKEITSKIIRNENELVSLCYMFETWLNLRKNPITSYRLLTAGELIYDVINRGEDVIKCFTINQWPVKYMLKVTTVSEDIKHYNKVSDIESIRRITVPSKRESMTMEARKVKLEDKFALCPIQTSDGALCGTINYLAYKAKITNKITYHNIEEGDIITYLNSRYIGNTSKTYIDKMEKDGSTIIIIDKLCFIYNLYGRIIKGENIVSYTPSLIPYRNYNPPIRSMFVCSMIKQAITKDLRLNLFNNTKVLIEAEDSPDGTLKAFGHNLKVAIMPWYGYNIEDAIVISKATAVKFRSRKQTIYREPLLKIFKIYIKIGDKISKFQPLYRTYNPKEIKTMETIYSNDDGIVNTLIKKENYFKLIISKTENMQIGDKMSNRHGQKGVVSLIVENSDMPYYYKKGVKINIDLIINPHTFPSRMTMGQIKEMMETGEEVKLNMTKNPIMVGNCYYMALRHQVADKIQYRESGDIDLITKQPVYGKKNVGGLRVGQMERDILLSVDAWNTLKELWSIDTITINVCPLDGKIEPKCCSYKRNCHQYLKVCLGYIRAIGYDIRLFKDNTYSIIHLNKETIPITDTKDFGDLDPLDLRCYKGVIMVPLCLRSPNLNLLYIKYLNKMEKDDKLIKKELKSLYKAKNGAYHKLVEGHRVNNCLRSVIVPNPNLPLDTIEIPLGSNIDTNYGILNRQPSLNKSSLAFVNLRQGKNKTITLNPLLCASFNADFDGDEMNVYGLKQALSIQEMKINLPVNPKETQDYILFKYLKLKNLAALTEYGITANKKDLELIVKSRAKGKKFNLEHIYHKIGLLKINDEVKEINECYNKSISEDNWYYLAMLARENAASIGVNTPITGYLESLCNQMYI